MESGQFWREDRVRELLDTEDAEVLFVAGCESNQGRFYDRLDHIVLLTAPPDTILHRIATRDTNDYGKSTGERQRILGHIETVEPLLRRSSDIVIDTSIMTVADTIAAILSQAGIGPDADRA